MRKIKFRGKRQDNNEWIYGYYWEREQLYGQNAIIIENYEQDDDTKQREHQVKRETVGQFIGLFDKSGSEIYEGDLIKRPVDKPFQRTHGEWTVQEIVYRTGMWICSYISSEKGFQMPRGYTAGEVNNCRDTGSKDIVFYNDERPIEEIEIIGNITDNKELLQAS